MEDIDIEDAFDDNDREWGLENDADEGFRVCHGSDEDSGRGYSGCGRVINPNECVACTDNEYCCECVPDLEDRMFCTEHKNEYLSYEGLAEKRNEEAYWRAVNGIDGGECEAAPDGDCTYCGKEGAFMYSACPACFNENFMTDGD